MSDAMRLGSGQMFDAIAERYDSVNRVLSMGLDLRWRRLTVQALAAVEPQRVLDLATGTADLGLAVAKTLHADVVGVDPSVGMLEVGRRKVAESGLESKVVLEVGDAQALEHADASFDACCIAFGIRNVPDRDLALREMRRVLRPGGRVAILELNEPRRGVLARLARFWIRQCVPRLGAWLSGDKEYRYLQKSIAEFPPPEDFLEQMRAAGFVAASVRRLTFGVCCLYVADVEGGLA